MMKSLLWITIELNVLICVVLFSCNALETTSDDDSVKSPSIWIRRSKGVKRQNYPSVHMANNRWLKLTSDIDKSSVSNQGCFGCDHQIPKEKDFFPPRLPPKRMQKPSVSIKIRRHFLPQHRRWHSRRRTWSHSSRRFSPRHLSKKLERESGKLARQETLLVKRLQETWRKNNQDSLNVNIGFHSRSGVGRSFGTKTSSKGSSSRHGIKGKNKGSNNLSAISQQIGENPFISKKYKSSSVDKTSKPVSLGLEKASKRVQVNKLIVATKEKEMMKKLRPLPRTLSDDSRKDLLNSLYKLRRQKNTLMEAFNASKDELDHNYGLIYNTTRRRMWLGARDALEGIHEANKNIIDGMAMAYRVTGTEMLKYHLQKESQGLGLSHDDPYAGYPLEAITILQNIQTRNFLNQKTRAKITLKEAETTSDYLHALESECLIGDADLQRVRDLLNERGLYKALIDVRRKINSVRKSLNRRFMNTRKMRRLRRQQQLKRRASAVIRGGQFVNRKSRMVLRTASSNHKRCLRMVAPWLKGRQNRTGMTRWKQADVLRVSDTFQKLSRSVAMIVIHSEDLAMKANLTQRILGGLLKDAQDFLNGKRGTDLLLGQIPPSADRLKYFNPEMNLTLSEIKMLVTNQVKPTRSTGCGGRRKQNDNNVPTFSKTHEDGSDCEEDKLNIIIEGSGDAEELETKKGNKVEDAQNKNNEINWWWSLSDSILENNLKDDPFDYNSKEEPIVEKANNDNITKEDHQLNKDLQHHWAESVMRSENLHEISVATNKSVQGLQAYWNKIQRQIGDVGRKTSMQQSQLKMMDSNAINLYDAKYRARSTILDLRMYERQRADLQLAVKMARAVAKNAHDSMTGKRLPKLPTWNLDKKEKSDNHSYDVAESAKQQDKEGLGYYVIHHKIESVMSNQRELKQLNSKISISCDTVCKRLSPLQKDLAIVQNKVKLARDMLHMLKLPIFKSGDSHLAVPVPYVSRNYDDMTSVRLSIKPSILDGTVVVLKGNHSSSYSLSLQARKVILRVFDSSWTNIGEMKLENSLQTNVWYTIDIQRIGWYLNLHLKEDGQVKENKSMILQALNSIQDKHFMVYIGGAPMDHYTFKGNWAGCIADLNVNGQSLNIFRPDSAGVRPSLCDNFKISSKKEKMSYIFNGDGFVLFDAPYTEQITSISFSIRTNQEWASLLSINSNQTDFNYYITLNAGALRIDSHLAKNASFYVRSNTSLSNGIAHAIKLQFDGSGVFNVQIDGTDEVLLKVERNMSHIPENMLQGILIGAFVKQSRQFLSEHLRPLIGCVDDIKINFDNALTVEPIESYKTYRGYCGDAQLTNVWHNCWQWSDSSPSLQLGHSVANSNSITLWLLSNSSGPLLYYSRKDDFTLEITLDSEGLIVSIDGSTSVLTRPDEAESKETFTITTVDNPNVKNVAVYAWNQQIEHSYGYSGWFFGRADPTKPHSIVIAGFSSDQNIEGTKKPQRFKGSIMHVAIENRLIDLSQFQSFHAVEPCKRPVKNINPPVTVPISQTKLIPCK